MSNDAENYEVNDTEAKATLRSISGKIGGALKDGWGFLLMLYEYGTQDKPGAMFYASSSDRESTTRMLREWLERQEKDVNPNHPLTSRLSGQWHKVAAILVSRCGAGGTVITAQEIEALGRTGAALVTATDTPEGLALRLVTGEESQRLAAAAEQLEKEVQR